jgi:molecular chaperone DnaK
MSRVVGIDLGTTYSAIAFLNDHGKPEIISNREGEQITPSVVLFDGEMPIVGSIAKKSAVQSPLNVVQFIKRQMGDRNWKFITDDGTTYTPEAISAIILRRLKEDAEAALDEEIRDAVITVPAYFNDAQRKATQDAGLIAGLNVLRIINEPTAAALAYGIDKLQKPETILVYDLGGGTFDVTIMSITKESIEVKATGGAKKLGGFDWDTTVMKFLNEEFMKQGGINLYDDPGHQQDLRDKAEIAKKTLSRNDKTNVFLSANGKNLSVTLMLAQFKEITASLLESTQLIMEQVLEEAGLKSWSQIDKTLLVGGSTRMKAVAALVEEVTGKKPSIELHPDEVVALGAAIQGALLAVQTGTAAPGIALKLPQIKVKDVNSHSLGVLAVSGDDTRKKYNSIVLKKDTHIPCKESNVYSTVIDQQEWIHVEVTEGEDPNPEYVKIVGEGEMAIPPYPKGAPIEVFFAYDLNGIVHVTVFDLTTNRLLGELQIERKSNLDEGAVQVMQKQIGGLAIN